MMRRWLGLLIVLIATTRISAQSVATFSSTPLSDRIVHYTIDARYDAVHHTLDASETLVYTNKTGQPQDTFPFHLYLNAFQPQSTFMREARRDGEDREWKEKYRGSIEIKQFVAAGMGDVTGNLQFVAPDDGNQDDRTVAQVKLPHPVAPGASVEFDIKFHDQFPETVARTGYYRNFIMGAQWFPKVGVWWHGAWNCHQFHETTEFFADFGVFDVKLTVPRNEVVGASGVQTAVAQNPDGTQTFTFHGEDIHDFAWTASPDFRVFEDTFRGSMGAVKIRALVHRGHADQGTRYIRALQATLERFDRWYGPYPYRQITLVDPEPGSAAGGMEYPTLFTAGTEWWLPAGLYEAEAVTEHEFGHQYWYGMVATNEFEEAWLDEGINQYVEAKVMDSLYGEQTSMLNVGGATAGEREVDHVEYAPFADRDPMVRKAYQFISRNSYGGITYGKTASMLLTLESVIGEDKVREALHNWFMRYRFTHPTGEDFLRTLQETAGRDLQPYFDQAVRNARVFDYEVLSIRSQPLNWWQEKDKKAGETVFRSDVVVHRKGDFIFPVDLEVRFSNGEHLREHWDGQDRWVRYTYDRKSRLASAEIDPDHKLWLDTNFFNNSRRLEPQLNAAHKLSHYWAFAMQMLAQALTWGF